MSGEVFAAAQSTSIRGSIEKNTLDHIKFIEEAATHGVCLLVFPELSLTGYEPDLAITHHLKPNDPKLQQMQELSCQYNMHILVGAPYQENEKRYITSFLYSPDDLPRLYTKHFLHPGEEHYFISGNKWVDFDVSGKKVAVAVCADISHIEHIERASSSGATVYAAGVFITPEGYAYDSSLLQGYSERYNMMVVMANYASSSGGYPSAGRSAIWDSLGNLIAVAPSNGEALVIASRDIRGLSGKVISMNK
jgi:predicted amidohydrolase